jgi:hypothetical protein
MEGVNDRYFINPPPGNPDINNKDIVYEVLWYSHMFSVCLPLSRALSHYPPTSLSKSLPLALPHLSLFLNVCLTQFFNLSISNSVSQSVSMYLSTFLFFCVPLSCPVIRSQVLKDTQNFWCHNWFKKSESIAKIQPKLILCLPSIPPPKKILLAVLTSKIGNA